MDGVEMCMLFQLYFYILLLLYIYTGFFQIVAFCTFKVVQTAKILFCWSPVTRPKDLTTEETLDIGFTSILPYLALNTSARPLPVQIVIIYTTSHQPKPNKLNTPDNL